MKLPKCTLGKNHKWQWVKNVNEIIETPRRASIRLKGAYRCKCGEIKYGEPK